MYGCGTPKTFPKRNEVFSYPLPDPRKGPLAICTECGRETVLMCFYLGTLILINEVVDCFRCKQLEVVDCFRCKLLFNYRFYFIYIYKYKLFTLKV